MGLWLYTTRVQHLSEVFAGWNKELAVCHFLDLQDSLGAERLSDAVIEPFESSCAGLCFGRAREILSTTPEQ